jgi:hypothetical protein
MTTANRHLTRRINGDVYLLENTFAMNEIKTILSLTRPRSAMLLTIEEMSADLP